MKVECRKKGVILMYKLLKICRNVILYRFALWLLVYFNLWSKFWSAFIDSRIADVVFSHIAFFPKIIAAVTTIYKLAGWPLIILFITLKIYKAIADRGGRLATPLAPASNSLSYTYIRILDDAGNEDILPIQRIHQSTLADGAVISYDDERKHATVIIDGKVRIVPSDSWLATRSYRIRTVMNY